MAQRGRPKGSGYWNADGTPRKKKDPDDPNDPPIRGKGFFYRTLQKLGAEHHPFTADGANEILDRYYEICDEYQCYHTAETMALAFGVTVPTLKRWLTGGGSRWSADALQVIALAYMSVSAETTDRLMNNEANTAGAIFLLKNNWGYTDQQTVMFDTNVNNQEEKVDVLSLKAKYSEYLDEGQGLEMLPETSVQNALSEQEKDRKAIVEATRNRKEKSGSPPSQRKVGLCTEAILEEAKEEE